MADAVPKYDDIKESSWEVGPSNASLNAIDDGVGTVFGAATTTAYDAVALSRMMVNTGTITVTGMTCPLYVGDGGAKYEFSEQRCLILSKNTSASSAQLSDYTLVKNIALNTSTQEFVLAEDGYYQIVTYDSLSTDIALDNTKFYWYAFYGRKPTTVYTASQVGFHRARTSHGANYGQFYYSGTITLPSEGASMPSKSANATSYPGLLNLRFTTEDASVFDYNGVLQNGGDPGVLMGFAPRRTDGPYGINAFYSKASAAGSQSLTLTGYEFDGTDKTASATNTMILDHTGNDRITWGGVHNSFDGSESPSDYYNITIMMDPSADTPWSKLMYENLTTGLAGGAGGYADVATICHEVKQASARDTESGDLNVETLAFTSSGTDWRIDDFKIGLPPRIVFGDSQCVDYLAADLQEDFGGSIWVAYVGGSRLSQAAGSTYVAGTTRYKGTAGVNDLCEFKGSLFIFCGMGINDIGASRTPAQFRTALEEIVDDWRTTGIEANRDLTLLCLPPVSDNDPSKESKEAYIRAYNDIIREVAHKNSVTYYDPMVVVQLSNTSYIQTGSPYIHYLEDGADLVSQKIAAAYVAGNAATGLSNKTRAFQVKNRMFSSSARRRVFSFWGFNSG